MSNLAEKRPQMTVNKMVIGNDDLDGVTGRVLPRHNMAFHDRTQQLTDRVFEGF